MIFLTKKNNKCEICVESKFIKILYYELFFLPLYEHAYLQQITDNLELICFSFLFMRVLNFFLNDLVFL
jgi:uncharacterized secreted protein with C-terminal beta-propeller domain